MAAPQRKLGPYTLIRKIGRGAFGVVWLAEKQTTIATTSFALKLPRDEDIDLDAFKREAAIWVHASGHPNVVSLIEADIYDDQVVLVSEYVPDGSLATWLKQHGGKAPSIESACEMIDGILAGLAHLHERRIIHRDLKPDNILLRRDTPRLADFGIARLLRSGSYSTNISGTLAYMAPEAFDGKRNEQTDIWAVGVIFYQLLAGRLPYSQQDTASFIGAIMRNDPPPLPDDLPEVLRRVVAKALQRDLTQRYTSATEMRRELRDAQRLLWLNHREAKDATRPPAAEAESNVVTAKLLETTMARGPVAAPTIAAITQEQHHPTDEETRPASSQTPPQKTVAFDPRLAPNYAPPLQTSTPKKSRAKVWVSTVAAILVIVAIKIFVAYWEAKQRGSSTPQAAPAPQAAKLEKNPAADIRRWLAMLGQSENIPEVERQTSAELTANPLNALALRARASAYYSTHEEAKGKQDAAEVERLLTSPLTIATSAEQYEARCYARMRLEKLDLAMEDCSRAIELDPQYAWAPLTRGNVYYNKKDYDHSITDYSKGIELNPSNSPAYANRGNSHFAKQDFDLALTDYNKAIELDPKLAPAYCNRGMIYSNRQDYENAWSNFNKAIELDPKLAQAYNGRGAYYYAKQDYDHALAEYNNAIEFDPKNAITYANRALTHDAKQEYDSALADCDKAIELDPRYAPAYANRCFIDNVKHDYKRAVADCSKAIGLDSRLATAYVDRGNARYATKDYDTALRDYNKAIELDPRNLRAYYNRGIIYYSKHDYRSSIANLTRVIQLDSRNTLAYFYRGNDYVATGEDDSAIADYNKAIELEPQNGYTYFNRGNAYYDKQDYNQAIADYTKAIQINPQFAAAYGNRANAYEKTGDSERADADRQKAQELKQ